jgi:hypothetical protein
MTISSNDDLRYLQPFSIGIFWMDRASIRAAMFDIALCYP